MKPTQHKIHVCAKDGQWVADTFIWKAVSVFDVPFHVKEKEWCMKIEPIANSQCSDGISCKSFVRIYDITHMNVIGQMAWSSRTGEPIEKKTTLKNIIREKGTVWEIQVRTECDFPCVGLLSCVTLEKKACNTKPHVKLSQVSRMFDQPQALKSESEQDYFELHKFNGGRGFTFSL